MSTKVALPLGLEERMSLSLNLTSKSPRPTSYPGAKGPSFLSCSSESTNCARDVLQCQDCVTARTIQPCDLVGQMEKTRPLLLDCRPFIAYNLKHITGALNISCADRFTKKRLERGKAKISDLVCGHNRKEQFNQLPSDIVLYDEKTTDPSCMQTNTPLSLVFSSLLKEGRSPVILKGTIQNLC